MLSFCWFQKCLSHLSEIITAWDISIYILAYGNEKVKTIVYHYQSILNYTEDDVLEEWLYFTTVLYRKFVIVYIHDNIVIIINNFTDTSPT